MILSAVLLTLLSVAVPGTYLVGTHLVARRKAGRDGRDSAHDDDCDDDGTCPTSTREAKNRYFVFSTLAWVVWATSFIAALLVMYHYLSQGEHLLLVHLGATFICSLFAEVFMISAFVAFANPATSNDEAATNNVTSIVVVLGTCMSILGGVLVSLIEFLPDQTSKLVYTFLSAVSILIGVTKTHGLGGWVMHRSFRRKRKDQRAKRSSDKFDSNWSFWQPGRGGSVFVVTQFFGWCFFATSLLGLAWVTKFALAQIAAGSALALRAISVPTAVVMIAAQVAIAGSLTFFKEGETKKTKGLRTSALEAYAHWRDHVELCLITFLFYCPHYIVISSILVPYLCLPSMYASSIMMGLCFPLHLLGSIGHPQHTGIRESQKFREWVGRSFERIYGRFLGGIRYVCEDDDDEGDGDGEGEARKREKYVFAYHPHALYPLGVVTFHLLPQFAKQLRYASVRPVTLVASVIFRLPFMRDLACLAGCREVTSRSFRRALRERGAVALVPGGQAELCVAPRAHSEANPEIVLNTRHKGFVKIAMEQGATIVPVLCFGEIYQLKNGISMPRLQAWTYKQFGFPIPFLPVGRFWMPVPLADRTHPTTFVIGKPLRTVKVEGGEITREQVERTHALYYARVVELYEKYKKSAGYDKCKLVLEHN